VKNCDGNANPSPFLVRSRFRWEIGFPVRMLWFPGSRYRKITIFPLKFEPFEGKFGYFAQP
jgi:hypothetical protein